MRGNAGLSARYMAAVPPALELSIERAAVHAERARCGCLVPAERLEHLFHVASLHLFDGHDRGRCAARVETHAWCLELADALGQVIDADVIELREGDGSLHALLELADVSGPGVAGEALGGGTRQPDHALGLTAVQKALREQENLVLPLPQRGDLNL